MLPLGAKRPTPNVNKGGSPNSPCLSRGCKLALTAACAAGHIRLMAGPLKKSGLDMDSFAGDRRRGFHVGLTEGRMCMDCVVNLIDRSF